MERMTARVYCAVLLCLSGCWSSTEALGRNTANPGVCPSRIYEEEMCAQIQRFVSCADDSDCANNEKCCSNGCGFQCMVAVTAKPGVCPSTRYEEEMCARIRFVPCANDRDCPNNEKCCSNGCGRQCMAPVTVKPGVCPKRKHKAVCWISSVPCVNDSDCPNNEKCCNTGCGRQCMPPV